MNDPINIAIAKYDALNKDFESILFKYTDLYRNILDELNTYISENKIYLKNKSDFYMLTGLDIDFGSFLLTNIEGPYQFELSKLDKNAVIKNSFKLRFYLRRIMKNLQLSERITPIYGIKYFEYEIVSYDEMVTFLHPGKKKKKYTEKYLYFFINETGRIKIGQAGNVEERRKALESASGQKVRILKVVEGAAKYESLLHKKFSKHKMIGEWFDQDQSLIDYVMNLTEDNLRDTFEPKKLF